MYLFGSRARGEHKPNSDVDVFVAPEEAWSFPDELVWERGKGPIDLWYLPDESGFSQAVLRPNEGILKDTYMVEMTQGDIESIAWIALARRRNPVLGATFNKMVIHFKELETKNVHGIGCKLDVITNCSIDYFVCDGNYYVSNRDSEDALQVLLFFEFLGYNRILNIEEKIITYELPSD